jgi:hypothetical protein
VGEYRSIVGRSAAGRPFARGPSLWHTTGRPRPDTVRGLLQHPVQLDHPDAELPFQLDSKPPTLPLRQFASSEARFAILARTAPAEFERLIAVAEEDSRERWRYYEQLATLPRTAPHLSLRPGATQAPSDEEAR